MIWLLSTALASSDYPSTLTTELAMPCTPTCTVCHSSSAGGNGTVTQAFGIAMMDNGMTGGSNTTSLQDALAALAAAGTDSDGDGLPDTEALTSGLDPNTGADLCGSTVTPPHYGCGKSSEAFLLVGLLGAGALRRRK